MKPYSRYKNSGVELIGEIPEGWAVKRFKFALSSLESGNRETGGGNQLSDGVFSVGGEHIGWFGELFDRDRKYISEEYYNAMTKGKIRVGDVLLVKDGATIGKCTFVREIPDGKSAVNEHVFIIRSNKEYFSRYIFYYIWCYIGQEQIRLQIRGSAQPGLNSFFQNYILIPYLSIDEQKVIAEYLDRKTTQIDDLIAKKERMIELLKEERVAIINQAVTKGIDPKVEMKNSGIGWLGNVPKHWKICAIKWITEIPITDGPHETPELFEEGIPFISAEAIKNDQIDFSKKWGFISIEENKRFSMKYKPRRGDIYMVKSGATTGNIAVVETDEEFNIWSPLAVIRPTKKVISSRYVFYFMKSRSFFSSVEIAWSFGTQQNIGMGVIGNLFIAIPNVVEQDKIVEYLSRKVKQINEQIIRAEQSIELLKEYRTALISEVVTGKIDVRN